MFELSVWLEWNGFETNQICKFFFLLFCGLKGQSSSSDLGVLEGLWTYYEAYGCIYINSKDIHVFVQFQMLSFMKAQATFFHQGQELYEDCEPYMKDIAEQVSELFVSLCDILH